MGCGNSNSLNEKKMYLNENRKRQPFVRKSCKRLSYKGVTILENVPKYIPDTVTRDEIKDMVYDALKINDDLSKKGKLNNDEIEGIIDMIMIIISSNDNKKVNDKRLDNLKAIIGFYDADKENVKRIFFKDKKPTDEEIEEKLNDIASMNEDTKLFAIEIQN